jgi:DivIVA domain-containing protein
MPLTPDEVVNKRFQYTKFREGYDQDEVDDFLDEVVIELRRLNAENEELKQRLAQTQARLTEQVSAPAFPEPTSAAAAAIPAPEDTNNSNSLLQLARKLHEEHVREGLNKRDQLIRDGQENAARIVREAEAQARAVLGQLERDRKAIENTIDELREFEHDYRGRLRDYIENQLETLLREEAFESAPSAAASQIEAESVAPVAAVSAISESVATESSEEK